MTNREKAENLDDKRFALFIVKACWDIRDISDWLKEEVDDEDSFWSEIEEEVSEKAK